MVRRDRLVTDEIFSHHSYEEVYEFSDSENASKYASQEKEQR
jgi:hypothetical protein